MLDLPKPLKIPIVSGHIQMILILRLIALSVSVWPQPLVPLL